MPPMMPPQGPPQGMPQSVGPMGPMPMGPGGGPMGPGGQPPMNPLIQALLMRIMGGGATPQGEPDQDEAMLQMLLQQQGMQGMPGMLPGMPPPGGGGMPPRPY